MLIKNRPIKFKIEKLCKLEDGNYLFLIMSDAPLNKEMASNLKETIKEMSEGELLEYSKINRSISIRRR